jgi:hypothetical protein
MRHLTRRPKRGLAMLAARHGEALGQINANDVGTSTDGAK